MYKFTCDLSLCLLHVVENNLCEVKLINLAWNESVSQLEGYVHQVDDTVAGAETQTIKFDLFPWKRKIYTVKHSTKLLHAIKHTKNQLVK